MARPPVLIKETAPHAMAHVGVRQSQLQHYDDGVHATGDAPARSRVDASKELRIRADPTGAKPFVFESVERPESTPGVPRARRRRGAPRAPLGRAGSSRRR